MNNKISNSPSSHIKILNLKLENYKKVNDYEIDLLIFWLLRNIHTITTITELRDQIVNSILHKKVIKLKFGIDPSGPHLHIGHLVPITKIKEFLSLTNSHLYLIIGDFTVLSHEYSRTNKYFDNKTIQNNIQSLTSELNQIFKEYSDRYTIVHNNDWLNKLEIKTIMTMINQFKIGTLLNKFAINKKQIDTTYNLSLGTLFYPILQAYDSVYLKNDIEFGSIDQLSNLYFARQITHQVNIMTQMIEDMKGNKMSKSLPDTCIYLTENNFISKFMSINDNVFFNFCIVLGLNHMINHDEANINIEKKKIAKFIYFTLCNNQSDYTNSYKHYYKILLSSIRNYKLIDILPIYLKQTKKNLKELFILNKVSINKQIITDYNMNINEVCSIEIAGNTLLEII